MKETNMEHFRGEIEAYMQTNTNDERNSCGWQFVKWLMSEYKPEPVLTAREKGFVECIRHGWIAADEVGSKMWYEDKPKKDKEPNVWLGKKIVTLNDDYFPFITWEDEEPWAVEDLRKLKVKGGAENDS